MKENSLTRLKNIAAITMAAAVMAVCAWITVPYTVPFTMQTFGVFFALLLLGAYYILIGFSLSRFITASYTNAVFDRFMNSRIEGAKVNQGLQSADDYDDDEEDPGDSDFTVNNNEEPATGKE